MSSLRGEEPADFEIRQKSDTDYFEYWRKGLAGVWDEEEREPVYMGMQFPRPGPMPPWPEGREPAPPGRPEELYKLDEDFGAGVDENKDEAEAANLELQQEIVAAGFHFVKLLGWGGCGVAALYEYEPLPGTVGSLGEKPKVVVKLDIGGAGAIPYELINHKKTAGAMHVIQQVKLVQPLESVAPTPARIAAGLLPSYEDGLKAWEERKSQKFFDSAANILFIEFMRGGRLYDYIIKADQSGAAFPELVMWRILECLFRGVVGMAFSRETRFPAEKGQPPPENITLYKETFEDMPPLRQLPDNETFIHFDIDPLNILVADFDGGDHQVAPMIKIADLGIGEWFSSKMTVLKNWKMRHCGKVLYLTPEQTSHQWDYCRTTPAQEGHSTGGNYNWWTNMYQVALIMFCLITTRDVEFPPTLSELPLIDVVNPSRGYTTELTWGGVLTLPDWRVDPILCHLVARCMIDDPARRPSMQDIATVLSRNCGPLPKEWDDALRYAQDYSMESFSKSRPPPPRPAARQYAATLPPLRPGRGAKAPGGPGGPPTHRSPPPQTLPKQPAPEQPAAGRPTPKAPTPRQIDTSKPLRKQVLLKQPSSPAQVAPKRPAPSQPASKGPAPKRRPMVGPSQLGTQELRRRMERMRMLSYESSVPTDDESHKTQDLQREIERQRLGSYLPSSQPDHDADLMHRSEQIRSEAQPASQGQRRSQPLQQEVNRQQRGSSRSSGSLGDLARRVQNMRRQLEQQRLQSNLTSSTPGDNADESTHQSEQLQGELQPASQGHGGTQSSDPFDSLARRAQDLQRQMEQQRMGSSQSSDRAEMQRLDRQIEQLQREGLAAPQGRRGTQALQRSIERLGEHLREELAALQGEGGPPSKESTPKRPAPVQSTRRGTRTSVLGEMERRRMGSYLPASEPDDTTDEQRSERQRMLSHRSSNSFDDLERRIQALRRELEQSRSRPLASSTRQVDADEQMADLSPVGSRGSQALQSDMDQRRSRSYVPSTRPAEQPPVGSHRSVGRQVLQSEMERLRMGSYLPSSAPDNDEHMEDIDDDEQMADQPPVSPGTTAQRRVFSGQLQQVLIPEHRGWSSSSQSREDDERVVEQPPADAGTAAQISPSHRRMFMRQLQQVQRGLQNPPGPDWDPGAAPQSSPSQRRIFGWQLEQVQRGLQNSHVLDWLPPDHGWF
ncbi:hypothetical protein QBC34DRAFT_149582 [Podospora aff. communis PSN243]|uniref:Protein kinase domain-containing protein n=1 Tax=Podospora aff. communis PSN243 TaxID=3040156 RepID=A0AAV9GCN3_9PEZI|nr:hypothetical protein QBC34DRAFT_149582 [Podospora aff. communis PSN243]